MIRLRWRNGQWARVHRQPAEIARCADCHKVGGGSAGLVRHGGQLICRDHLPEGDQ